jgi:tRNA dimethylallyltransferase
MSPYLFSPLVAIVGQTASGKSSLAQEIARELDVEIVCADSRTLYRELQLGAAAPSPAELATCPHHLAGILDLDAMLTGPAYVERADAAICSITMRDKLPLVVGGTALFVDSLLFRLNRWPLDALEHARLQAASLETIREQFISSGTALPLNHQDKQTLIATLDGNRLHEPFGPPRRDALILGVGPFDRETLALRIAARVEGMLAAGLEAEVRGICALHARQAGSINSIGYEEWDAFLAGRGGREELVALLVENTLIYADGQASWLDALPGLHWVENAEQALGLIETWKDSSG